jgi:hypothetical protein
LMLTNFGLFLFSHYKTDRVFVEIELGWKLVKWES